MNTQGSNKLTYMPFGPSPAYGWVERIPAPATTAPDGQQISGEEKIKYTPAGYLAMWNAQPRVPPPSWNSLLLQGNNLFQQGINKPSLKRIM